MPEAVSKGVFVSIIIPVFNEALAIAHFLNALQPLRKQGCELILVDGGSTDDTLKIAKPLVDSCLQSASGRAKQMNTGAQHAQGHYCLFLHADTYLPAAENWFPELLTHKPLWGFFPVRLNGQAWPFRMIEYSMNRRSALTAVATGDQCLVVERAYFLVNQGYPDIPLMEDVAISKALRRVAKPWVFEMPVVTSSRRWQQQGIIKTVLLMWALRLGYFLGCEPVRLHRYYYGRR